MGSKHNKSNLEEEENTITLDEEGITSYLESRLKNFDRKSQVISLIKTFMSGKRSNKFTIDNKWENHKNNKYTEKKIDIFSCSIDYNDNDNSFTLKYYYYSAYYLNYLNFTFISNDQEKIFNDIRQTIDANYRGEGKIIKIKKDIDTISTENQNENSVPLLINEDENN